MNSVSSCSRAQVPINCDRLLKGFVDILSVDSYWGNENRVVEIIRPRLEAVGVHCKQDEIGNLIGQWRAHGKSKSSQPIMLNAHMDTVQPTPGMRPVVKGDAVYSDGTSVLGADDKAGVAAIVEAVVAVHASGLEHGPIDLVFTVGEDVGQYGADAFDANEIESRLGLVLDFGGPVGDVINHQAGSCSFDATFYGTAAAAAHPAPGVSAIAMMARAVENMPLGQINEETVANVGIVSGGQARNIVPPEARMLGQARGLDQAGLDQQMDVMRKAVEDAAAAFGGRVEIKQEGRFKPTKFGEDHPAIRLADVAIRAIGLQPRHVHTFGGSDAQNFNEKGIETAILGTGYRDMHSVAESMPHEELQRLTQVTVELLLGA